MPLDGSQITDGIVALALFRENPTPAAFVEILRHHEWWIEDFGTFHFGYCGQCAMGVLGFILGTNVNAMHDAGEQVSKWAAKVLDIPIEAAQEIFGAGIMMGSHAHVRPGDVANRLARWLKANPQ